jgi:hypothetical protein
MPPKTFKKINTLGYVARLVMQIDVTYVHERWLAKYGLS